MTNSKFARLFPGNVDVAVVAALKGPALRKAVRPYFTAGVAFIGASTLAIMPVIATPPDIAIANPDVQLSVSPIDPYLAIFARARANAEALLDAALGGPPAGGTSIEDLLDRLFGDPSRNFRDVVQANRAGLQLLPTQLDVLRGVASGQFASAFDGLAVGDVNSAMNHLLVNGIGTTAEVVHNLIRALRSEDPAEVLAALATGPALIASRVLDAGYASAAQVVQGLLSAPAPVAVNLSGERRQPATFDIEFSPATHAGERDSLGIDSETVNDPDKGATDPDEGINVKVMADNGATDLGDGTRAHSRLSNDGPTSRSGGAPSLTAVRKGIRGLRDGIRNAVKAATGRGDDAGAAAAGTDESP